MGLLELEKISAKIFHKEWKRWTQRDRTGWNRRDDARLVHRHWGMDVSGDADFQNPVGYTGLRMQQAERIASAGYLRYTSNQKYS